MCISDGSSDVCSSDLRDDDADQKGHQPDDRQRVDPDALESGDDRAPANAATRANLGDEGDDHRAEKADDADEIGPHADAGGAQLDRKSVGEGKSGYVRVDLGGRRLLKKKKKKN